MKYFQQKDLHILHLNINNLLPKINEVWFIAKQSSPSIIGISETKLDLSILNSEVDIEGYYVIRMDSLKKGGGIACLENHYLVIIRKKRHFLA